jgi:hypothetical protein
VTYNTDSNGIQTLSATPIGDTGLVIQNNFSTISTLVTARLPLAGGTMTGAINLGTNNITNVGKIGIGTTNPAQPLDVAGPTILRNAASTAALTFNGATITTTGTASSIPVSIVSKFLGGLIFGDINGSLVSSLGVGAIDLQGSIGSAKPGTAAAAGSALLGGNGQNTIAVGANESAIIGGASNTITSGIYNIVVAGSSITMNLPSYTLATGILTTPRTSYGIYQSANDTFTFPFSPAQTAVIPLIGTTTDGTTFVTLTAGGTSRAANDNVITILSNMSVCFTAHVVGRSFTNNNLVAAYELKGVIDNNGVTTAIIGSVTKTILGDETGGLFSAQAVALTSPSQLAIQVRGSALNTVRWSARLQMVEISGLTGGGVS